MLRASSVEPRPAAAVSSSTTPNQNAPNTATGTPASDPKRLI